MKNISFSLLALGTVLLASCSSDFSKTDGGFIAGTPAGKVRLQAVTDKIIRVSAVPEGKFKADSSLVVLPQKTKAEYTITKTDSTITLATSEISATLAKSTGVVTFRDKDGNVILREKEGGRSFVPYSADGETAWSVTQSFESLDDSEGIYGLGQHQANEWNYKNKNEELFQYNTKVSVPFVVSTGNYGILWDSYSLCRWGNPEEYSQLGDIFTLYDKNGKEGSLTGTYTAADGKTIVRDEPQIYFENLIRGDLSHVINLPQDFSFAGSKVQYEGEIEPKVSGKYDFILYYSGYQTIRIGGKEVVPERWRTAWNPNSYKFSVDLEAGVRTPISIDWEPNGGVAYCGLRAYAPSADREKGEMCWWSQMQDMEDYYFVYGTSADDVISGYRTLTGKAQIMPKWAMGYWQSREKYNTQKEVLSTLSEFRKRQIPIDNIVIDWLHWKQDSWGSHEFDRDRFPDPKKMIDSIHSLDARVMISVWPKFYVTTEHYKEFDKNGWMYQGAVRDSIRDWVGPGYLGSFYDAYDPDARKLFWSQMNDHYMPLGIDAWWMDASEPNVRDCIDIEYRKDLMNPTHAGTADKYFNAYALMNAEAIYDGQRGVDPDKRVFLLTRSGFAGQQRYSTATWSGDIATRWEDMEAQIAAGLNFAMSGIPYWTMDIGGFCVEDRYVVAQQLFNATGRENADLREWRELNNRWYQFGAFAPLFRAHGQWPFREVFNIAPEGHPAYKSIVYYTRLRYRLMPYIYSLAGMTHFNDYTIMRPLVMDFAADKAVRDISDEYMFGPSILVAPVYKYGQRERSVYLPSGHRWYNFYTGAVTEGGQTVTADAPYERIPLFVPSGAILPMGGDIQSTKETSAEPLTVLVYAGNDGSFTLYDDEGVNYNYEKGSFARIPLTFDNATSTLTIGAREGSYPGMPAECTFNIVLVNEGNLIGADSRPAGKLVEYTGAEKQIKL